MKLKIGIFSFDIIFRICISVLELWDIQKNTVGEEKEDRNTEEIKDAKKRNKLI